MRAGIPRIGGTYVGNPVAQAAALAVLDVIEEDGLSERCGARRRHARGWRAGSSAGRRSGRGPRRDDRDRARPRSRDEAAAPDLATEVVDHAARNGPLLLKAGIYSNCIRVLTSACPTELDEALGVWEQASSTRSQLIRLREAVPC